MIKRVVLVLCSVITLAACHRTAPPENGNDPNGAARTGAGVKKGPTAVEQTAGMISAVVVGKSTAPIDLKFEIAARPRLGSVLTVNLALLPQIDADGVDVQVLDSDGFDVDKAAAGFSLPAVAADSLYRQAVKLTPTRHGVLALLLGVTMRHDETTETRSYAVPIVVEDVPPK